MKLHNGMTAPTSARTHPNLRRPNNGRKPMLDWEAAVTSGGGTLTRGVDFPADKLPRAVCSSLWQQADKRGYIASFRVDGDVIHFTTKFVRAPRPAK